MRELLNIFVRGIPVGKPRQTFRAIPLKTNGVQMYRGKWPVHTAVAYHDSDHFAECDIWQEKIRQHVRSMMGRPDVPAATPLRCDIEFYFPRPAYLQTAKSPKGIIPFAQKPDRDNLDKAVLDALGTVWLVPDPRNPTESKAVGIWDDDKRVVSGEVEKWYIALGEATGARIIVNVLTEYEPQLFTNEPVELGRGR